jgi:hypothetical protein
MRDYIIKTKAIEHDISKISDDEYDIVKKYLYDNISKGD